MRSRVTTLENRDPAIPYYFPTVAELEREATEIRHYGGALIPGLLQTKAYARAVFEAYRPNHCAEELDELVVSRTKRGQLLDKTSKPETWVLLDERALRRRVGGSQVMAEQLHKVADMADSGRLRLHVLTLASGAHSLMESMVYLLSFADAAPVAWVEGLRTGRLLDDFAMVAACHTSYTLALSDAAPREESVALVRSIAEEHEHAQHRAHHR
ncbi:DUF5753 domain-containing protein [Streptomyces anulatus]